MSKHKLFDAEAISSAPFHVQEGMSFKGGTMTVNDDLIVDCQLEDVTIVSTKGIVDISPLGVLTNCKIMCQSLLLEGRFEGVLNVEHKAEFANGCTAIGIMNNCDDLSINRWADVDSLQFRKDRQPEQAQVQNVATVHSFNTGTN